MAPAAPGRRLAPHLASLLPLLVLFATPSGTLGSGGKGSDKWGKFRSEAGCDSSCAVHQVYKVKVPMAGNVWRKTANGARVVGNAGRKLLKWGTLGLSDAVGLTNREFHDHSHDAVTILMICGGAHVYATADYSKAHGAVWRCGRFHEELSTSHHMGCQWNGQGSRLGDLHSRFFHQIQEGSRYSLRSNNCDHWAEAFIRDIRATTTCR